MVLTNTFGGKTYIEEAAYVTGNISSYVQSESEASIATINGTAYEVSDIGYGVKSDATHPFNSVKDTFAHEYNGKVYNYYQDAYGNIRAWALAARMRSVTAWFCPMTSTRPVPMLMSGMSSI